MKQPFFMLIKIYLKLKILTKQITITHQTDRGNIFRGIINKDEYYYFTVCNPPFFKSEKDALKASMRKWKNLKK